MVPCMTPADAHLRLQTFLGIGLAGLAIGAVMVVAGSPDGGPLMLLGWVVLGIGQIALVVSLIGWGVVLGVKASQHQPVAAKPGWAEFPAHEDD